MKQSWKFQVREKSGSRNIFFEVRWGFWDSWMIQKSKKIFLLQITQNGPIHENKWFLAYLIFFLHTVVTRLPDLVIFGRFLKMMLLIVLDNLHNH